MGRGKYTVFEGLDGIGKGLVRRTLLAWEESRGKIPVKSIIERSNEPREFESEGDSLVGNILIADEPTNYWIGMLIRGEIIKNNSRIYSPESQVQAYSIDRLTQMRRLVSPFLKRGGDVFQGRNVASTLCYQSLQAKQSGYSLRWIRDYILEQEGTQITFQNSPDLMIISTIDDVKKVIERIEKRRPIKNDDSKFETLRFQEALKPFYEDDWLRELFEKNGTRVAYLNAGISEESTAEQAIEIYSDFYEKGEIKSIYSKP